MPKIATEALHNRRLLAGAYKTDQNERAMAINNRPATMHIAFPLDGRLGGFVPCGLSTLAHCHKFYKWLLDDGVTIQSPQIYLVWTMLYCVKACRS
jgi:hypothetical protein